MTRILGIDPGPVPGFVVLWTGDGRVSSVDVIQCTHQVAATVFNGLLKDHGPMIVQVERFVVGRSSMRSAGPGEVTRNLIGNFQRLVTEHNAAARTTGYGPVSLLERSASQVKPWATDTRLEAAGLLAVTKGMRHAKDAARHALFAAVKDGGLPDPLSTRFKEQNR